MYDFEIALVDVLKTFYPDSSEEDITSKTEHFYNKNRDYRLFFKVDKKLRKVCCIKKAVVSGEYLLLKLSDSESQLKRNDAVIIPRVYSSTQQEAVFVVEKRYGVYFKLLPTQVSVTLLRKLPENIYLEIV